MGYKDMRGAMEEIIGEKKSQETDEEILQIYHQCERLLHDNDNYDQTIANDKHPAFKASLGNSIFSA